MRRQTLTQGLSQQRHELLTKLYLVGTPTSRIRQFNVTTCPAGLLLTRLTFARIERTTVTMIFG